MLHGRPVLAWTIDAFASHPRVHDVVVVLHPDDSEMFAAMAGDLPGQYQIAPGGMDRASSVASGLEVAPTGTECVLIHDGARPLVSPHIIDRVLEALHTHQGAAPAISVTDALWHGAEGRVRGTQDRTGLWRAQTPQGFHFSAIRSAHAAHPGGAADDVAVAMAAGLDVAIVEGEERNLKITRREDFVRAAKMMETHLDIRTGNGFDVHRFCDGDHVVICGIQIPFDKALDGHSDADVGMHAVTDAIYGALAAGDIGQHFPPSDLQWKAAASEIFLVHAVELARTKGYRIGNADCTLICELPKIGPHAMAMRTEMARIMGLEVDRISVKATTSERLGFTGRGEGIAAMASVTLVPL